MKLALLPAILISVGTALFIFCKFVVVKTFCFAYPAEHGEWSSFLEMLIFAWTHDESPDGVRYELFGPVDFFKDYVYIFCALLVIAGIVLLLRTQRDRSKAGQKKAGESNMADFPAIAKKVSTVLLRLIGCLLVISLIGTAADFLDSWLYLMYGAERVVGVRNVIYIGDLWEYDYTNPMAMIRSRMTIFFGIAIVVLSLSVLAAWCAQRLKLFIRVGKFDKFLITALVLSAVACVFCGGMLSQENMVHAKRYHAVESCKSLADYEKLLGRPLFAGPVRESDRAWIEALGNFKNSGFVPGRTLAIFGMDRPRVYVLVWMENEQVVQRNGCYRTECRLSSADK